MISKITILVVIGCINILWANNLQFCPKNIVLLKDKNFTKHKIEKGILFIKDIKHPFTKLALFDKNGVLKYAGVYGYAGFPKGVWCYKTKNKYHYKDFDKPLTRKEKDIIDFYEKLLKDKRVGEFRVYKTYKNIIGIDFKGFIIFIDIDNNKLVKALYYNGYDNKDKIINNLNLKKVNNCIKKAIKNYKTKKEIENICNLNFNIIVPDSSWGWSESYEEAN